MTAGKVTTDTAATFPAANLAPSALPWSRAVSQRTAQLEDGQAKHDDKILDTNKSVLSVLRATAKLQSIQNVFHALGIYQDLPSADPNESDVTQYLPFFEVLSRNFTVQAGGQDNAAIFLQVKPDPTSGGAAPSQTMFSPRYAQSALVDPDSGQQIAYWELTPTGVFIQSSPVGRGSVEISLLGSSGQASINVQNANGDSSDLYFSVDSGGHARFSAGPLEMFWAGSSYVLTLNGAPVGGSSGGGSSFSLTDHVQGEFMDGMIYSHNDIVSNHGGLYVARSDGVSTEPLGDDEFWMTMSPATS